jgi:hypothetical protein
MRRFARAYLDLWIIADQISPSFIFNNLFRRREFMIGTLPAKTITTTLIAALTFTTLPANQTVAATGATETAPRDELAMHGDQLPSQAEMAQRVQAEFLHAWDGYHQYALGA